MGKIIFITGGARSGKSTLALVKAQKSKGRIAFIATCEPKDNEMKKRIALHRNLRPASWVTFEEPCDLEKTLKKTGSAFKTIIIDCLTLWVTNLMMKKTPSSKIEKRAKNIIGLMKKVKADCILVTNEVGLGIVPDNKLSRDFRDVAGRINQIAARASKEAYFTVSGIPTRIK